MCENQAFQNKNELVCSAVDAYHADNSNSTSVAQTYSHPIGSWYVGVDHDMSPLFYKSDLDASDFNDNIQCWDTSSVQNMNSILAVPDMRAKVLVNTPEFDQPLNSWDTST